jgi:hypothetical protein
VNAINVDALPEFKNLLKPPYPIPAFKSIYLDDQKYNSSFILFNTFGKVINQGTFNDQIDVSTLSDGIYFIQINPESIGSRFYKIVKQSD